MHSARLLSLPPLLIISIILPQVRGYRLQTMLHRPLSRGATTPFLLLGGSLRYTVAVTPLSTDTTESTGVSVIESEDRVTSRFRQL